MGLSKTEIAKKLEMSRSTVMRDFKHLKLEMKERIRDMAEDNDYLFEHMAELDRLNDLIHSLYKQRENATKISEVIAINRAIADISYKRFELHDKAPMVTSFHKFVEENVNKIKSIENHPNYISFIP